MKIDWKRKLSSRKFWLSITNFVTLIIVALGYTDTQAAQVSAIIMAGASVVAYIIAEGLTDSANAGILYSEKEDEEDGKTDKVSIGFSAESETKERD